MHPRLQWASHSSGLNWINLPLLRQLLLTTPAPEGFPCGREEDTGACGSKEGARETLGKCQWTECGGEQHNSFPPTISIRAEIPIIIPMFLPGLLSFLFGNLICLSVRACCLWLGLQGRGPTVCQAGLLPSFFQFRRRLLYGRSRYPRHPVLTLL